MRRGAGRAPSLKGDVLSNTVDTVFSGNIFSFFQNGIPRFSSQSFHC